MKRLIGFPFAILEWIINKTRTSEEGVPFPSSLFGLPVKEYEEKKDYYENLSWAIIVLYFLVVIDIVFRIL